MSRLDEMLEQRKYSAEFYRTLGLELQTPNGDQQRFPDLRGTFTKGLPHDPVTGLGDVAAFNHLYSDLTKLYPTPPTQSPLIDPMSGFAYDTEGPDAHQFAQPPAPRFDSDLEIAEIAENYWMALLRDTPFDSYATSDLAEQAAAHLSTFENYAGVTPTTLFRTPLEGAEIGPYLSQFLMWDVPYGSQRTPNQIAFSLPLGQDYMTDWASYLAVQNGATITTPAILPLDTPRYIGSGRDMSQYVHIDELFQAYLNACLILISPTNRGGFGAMADQGNPYAGAEISHNPVQPRHMNQVGFGTLGEPNFKTITCEVATRALKHVWHQKWSVHRRLRPEEFGGRLEAQRKGALHGFISERHINQLMPVLKIVEKNHGTWLLPQAFPEGCPIHPSYGAGHATVAGACITVLKAIFYTPSKLSDLGISPLKIDANGNRVPYTGSDAEDLSVLGELNKLAASIGVSRNLAGVHWRSDFTESVVLGERLALYYLQEHAHCFREHVSFHVRTFGGTDIVIRKGEQKTFPPYSLGSSATAAAHT